VCSIAAHRIAFDITDHGVRLASDRIRLTREKHGTHRPESLITMDMRQLDISLSAETVSQRRSLHGWRSIYFIMPGDMKLSKVRRAKCKCLRLVVSNLPARFGEEQVDDNPLHMLLEHQRSAAVRVPGFVSSLVGSALPHQIGWNTVNTKTLHGDF
jgi:hypothetical protein